MELRRRCTILDAFPGSHTLRLSWLVMYGTLTAVLFLIAPTVRYQAFQMKRLQRLKLNPLGPSKHNGFIDNPGSLISTWTEQCVTVGMGLCVMQANYDVNNADEDVLQASVQDFEWGQARVDVALDCIRDCIKNVTRPVH
jgi:hypothetical protein